jgi:hypothetical protein
MIRIMRFSSIFQGIIKRSGEVIPSLVGPLALVLTAVHLFTYVGMYLWGGAITIGSYDGKIPALYGTIIDFNCIFPPSHLGSSTLFHLNKVLHFLFDLLTV